MGEQRFLTNWKGLPVTDDPGLVLGDDEQVYLVLPDGSRHTIAGDSPVQSVNGQTGVVVLDAADVGAITRIQDATDFLSVWLPLFTDSTGTGLSVVVWNPNAPWPIASDLASPSASILSAGLATYNLIAGGDGWATVEAVTAAAKAKGANAAMLGTNAVLPVMGGYDLVAGDIASILLGFHCWSGVGAPHAHIVGGTKNIIAAGRLDFCGVTNGSATITDTSITAADLGARITSPGNLVQGTYITAVTPGVSFTASTNWLGVSGNAPIGIVRQRSVGVINNSTTVTDAAVVSGDNGSLVFGTGWPAGTTITAVNAGVGFTTSNAWTGTTGTVTAIIVPAQASYNAIHGGTQNMIFGGTAARASGQNNAVSGRAASALGEGNYVNANDATAIGANHQVTGLGSTAVGSGHIITPQYAYGIGYRAMPRNDGELAHADGYFATQGDAQQRKLVLRAKTTNATSTTLADQTGNNPVIAANSTCLFKLTVVARRTDAAADDGFTWQGIYRRTGSGAPSAIVAGTVVQLGSSSWTVTISTGGTSLHVNVTGESGKTIQWVGYLEVTETVG